jgi:5,10-methylenetetrahydromethanopterin reductase
LKFGIRLADWFGTTQNMVDLAVLGEKNSFDFVWVSHDVFMRSSFVTLATIANRTSRVKLGNTILNPYTVNPSELAMFLASMDEISSKRMVCGISAGSLEYMDWLGIPHQKPLTRTKESIQLIRSLLSGKVVKYDGKEFHWSEQCYMRFEPPRRSIPIYIGGQGDLMLEYSGEAGEGSLPLLYPPDFAEYAVAKISEGARKVGKDPSTVDIAGCVWISIAKDRQSAAIDPLKELVAYFGPLLGVKGLAAVGLSHQEFSPVHEEFKKSGIKSALRLVTDKMLKLAIYGSPDDCIERLENLQRSGVTQVLLGAPLGPDPQEAIRIMGQKIIPYFSKKN